MLILRGPVLRRFLGAHDALLSIVVAVACCHGVSSTPRSRETAGLSYIIFRQAWRSRYRLPSALGAKGVVPLVLSVGSYLFRHVQIGISLVQRINDPVAVRRVQAWARTCLHEQAGHFWIDHADVPVVAILG